MSNLTDEKLLKRAGNAGRNLFALASLATVAAIGLGVLTFLVKEAPWVTGVMAAILALIAAGYWVLAVAARRGNPNAVGTVLVIAVVGFVLSLVSSGVASARKGTGFEPNGSGLVIPILVILALASSRKVLLELRERGLWEQAFGSAKPTGNLCLIGGSLLVAGFLALNSSAFFVGWKAGKERSTE